MRDYETVKVEQEVPNEFLLVLDDGMSADSPRAKGAYYKNIERKMLLKKKRVNVRFPPPFPLGRHTPADLTLCRRTRRTATSGTS